MQYYLFSWLVYIPKFINLCVLTATQIRSCQQSLSLQSDHRFLFSCQVDILFTSNKHDVTVPGFCCVCFASKPFNAQCIIFQMFEFLRALHHQWDFPPT